MMWSWLLYFFIAVVILGIFLNFILYILKGFFCLLVVLFYILGSICFVFGGIAKILRVPLKIFEFAFVFFKVGREIINLLNLMSSDPKNGVFHRFLKIEIQKLQRISDEYKKSYEEEIKSEVLKTTYGKYSKRPLKMLMEKEVKLSQKRIKNY